MWAAPGRAATSLPSLCRDRHHGHVIAEALQAGCPVIATSTTPWTQVLRNGGGEIIEDRDNASEVAEVLDRWAAMTPDELTTSGRDARSAFDTFSAHAAPNIVELALASLANTASTRAAGSSHEVSEG